MKKIIRNLLVLMLLVSLAASFSVAAFAEDETKVEDTPAAEETVQPTEEPAAESPSEESAEEPAAEEQAAEKKTGTPQIVEEYDLTQEETTTTKKPSYTGSGSPTITLTASSSTLAVGQSFGTTYSQSATYDGQSYVIAYDYVLYDSKGNKTDGAEAGTYTVRVENVRVYAADDAGYNNNLASKFNISTVDGTLTRVNSGSSSSSSGTSSGSTSSTTSVKTGDESNFAAWCIALVCSAAVLSTAVVVIKRKRS